MLAAQRVTRQIRRRWSVARNKRTKGAGATDIRVTGVGTKTTAPVTYTIDGYTKDSAGAIIPSASVFLFRTDTKAYVSATTSDLGGYYTFTVDNNTVEYFLVGYKDGSPDLAGTTIKTVVGA